MFVQVLDPTGLVTGSYHPPTCCTVPTAAILPPPPSFLPSYPPAPVQTVPLLSSSSHNFITLPRHTKK